MQDYNMKNKAFTNSQEGFMLISVIVLMALTLLVAAGMVNSKVTEAKIRATSNSQLDNYSKVEETMSKTVTWLQDNQRNIVGAFLSSNFTNNFDLTVPSIGANESANFSVPTLVKIKGTSNSVMLSNNSLFGTSAFPNTTNITTGVAFNAVSAFATADLGQANTRIVLVWARNSAGNYQPVFRVDTVTEDSPDRGIHSFTYVYSSLVSSTGAAFYTTTGPITLNTGNNSCASNNWTYSAGSWSSGAPRANCVIASDSNVSTNANINGNVLSKAVVNVNSPSGGVSGSICQNSTSCHGLSLANFDSWATTCGASNQGNLTISANTTLTVAGNLASQKCWRDVTINSNRTLTLNTTTFPYHFRTLTLQNNSNSKIAFANVTSGQYITLNVESINGNSINGSQWSNANNSPSQIRLNITGSGSLTLNGTAIVRADLKAPLVAITLSGNFNFYGGIRAQSISATGNARLYADEALSGATSVTGLNFAQTKASQRYRLY